MLGNFIQASLKCNIYIKDGEHNIKYLLNGIIYILQNHLKTSTTTKNNYVVTLLKNLGLGNRP